VFLLLIIVGAIPRRNNLHFGIFPDHSRQYADIPRWLSLAVYLWVTSRYLARAWHFRSSSHGSGPASAPPPVPVRHPAPAPETRLPAGKNRPGPGPLSAPRMIELKGMSNKDFAVDVREFYVSVKGL
jgi:hypothetical protein